MVVPKSNIAILVDKIILKPGAFDICLLLTKERVFLVLGVTVT